MALLHIESKISIKEISSLCVILSKILCVCVFRIEKYEKSCLSKLRSLEKYIDQIYISTHEMVVKLIRLRVREILYLYFFHSNFYFYWKKFVYCSRYVDMYLLS